MTNSSDAGPGDHSHHHGPIQAIADLILRHHERVARERRERQLAEAAERAGFDLEADIGHPRMHSREDPFDPDAVQEPQDSGNGRP
ncbi:hypothetical protein [Nonomuraea sp. SYSU D8015]|uniref:hypothetical protein n=1 Tax=Nonomuraea sp. SYSU D8015 TaxID=2593644 RepID=UPI0016606463|nr:hypothetical protein [Nonomuraea sp. SYSU D8015]